MRARPLHLSLLLHMHQPWYVTPESTPAGWAGDLGHLHALLPWVRLHGAAGYLDVATALMRHPGARLTVNLVPSLLVQLQAVAAGARDRYLDLCERPIEELDLDDRAFLLSRLFSINWSRGVEPRPRYRELLDKRGRHATPGEIRRRAALFTKEELRDLTVLFHLAWLGWAAREGDEALSALERKGGGFSRDDLHVVVERGRAACGKVIPLYRTLMERGQIEISCSPAYHPIVPLLCDSDVAREPRPDTALPPRFAWPEDAASQIRRGREVFQRCFGQQAGGMWPPEGSISRAALAAYAEAGTTWLVSDEGNLWRSLGGCPGDRDGGERGRASALCRAYEHEGVALFFREHDLSDRIGFRYAHAEAGAAVSDLLHGASRAAAGFAGDEAPIVTVALDGENPWQAYPDHGAPFLDALLSALARRPVLGDHEIAPVTFSEHLGMNRDRAAPRPLPRLCAGSWIDSDFHIWIGDPVKNRAWTLLGEAREALARARDMDMDRGAGPGPGPGIDQAGLDRAAEMLLCAEGSDWFWWFGEPFHSSEDALYDALFRGYLQEAYRALRRPVPAALLDPVDDRPARPGREGLDVHQPRRFISPRIDGERSSFYEWSGAGVYRVAQGAAMADRPEVAAIYFGFDRERLYLRVDPARPGLLREAQVAFDIEVGTGLDQDPGPRLRVLVDPDHPEVWQLLAPQEDGGSRRFRPLCEGGPAAIGQILEVALPWSALKARPGAALALVLRLLLRGEPRARYPRDGSIALTVPDDLFEVAHWACPDD